MSVLNELGNKYATDKSSKGKYHNKDGLGHDYLRIYETVFAPRRDQVRKLLEIGVQKGASLRVWEEYFPKAQIFGIDIAQSAKSAASDRIAIHLLDQSNETALTDFCREYGPFDIIIEDGSHLWEHQINNIKWLIPHVKKGGIYIVEDLHTSYSPEFGDDTQKTAVDFVLEIGRDIISERASAGLTDRSRRTISARLESVLIMRRAAVLLVA